MGEIQLVIFGWLQLELATLTLDIVALARNRFYRAMHKSVSHQTEPEQMCTAVDHIDRIIVGKNVMSRPIDAITSK